MCEENNEESKNSVSIQGELHNWSRQYDVILWQATAIFVAAISVLLFENAKEERLFIYISGMILTIIAVYISVAFRQLRFNVHLQMLSEHQKIFFINKKIIHRYFGLWYCYVAIFCLMQLGFTVMRIQKLRTCNESSFWPVGVLLFCWFVMWLFFKNAPSVGDKKSLGFQDEK